MLPDVENRWGVFCTASEEKGLRLPDDPAFLDTAKKVFVFSDFVWKNCFTNPNLLFDLFETKDLERRYKNDDHPRRLERLLRPIDHEADLMAILRQFRCREMVRIAWRDLAGRASLSETMTDLTWFSDACIDLSLTLLYQWHCARYGVPLNELGTRQHLVVIGMGKLGGEEMNFSSDVDLIFAYPDSGQTLGGPQIVSNAQFFLKLCRHLIKVLGSPTPDGIVFRIDLRLRPDGDNGPLVMSFDNLENYYQVHGREWERYAWIKARVVAGDKNEGKVLLDRLNPFVYRRYLDYGMFESLREMKRRISLEVKRKQMDDNIKLGSGGIREIEFFGQVFQLIRGGVVPGLQDRRILPVLKKLVHENVIPQDTHNELHDAYVFLRKTENRLQEFSDQQTHMLPCDPEDQNRLACTMGFDDWHSFDQCLKRHMESVHRHFSQLLSPKEDTENQIHPSTGEFADQEALMSVWLETLDSSEGKKTLKKAGFNSPKKVLQLMDNLRNDSRTRALNDEGRSRLDQLMPLILRYVGKIEKPVLTMTRIIDLIKTIERRISYLALLLENSSALAHLVRLFEASPWIASFLTRHPVLLDELLDPRTLYMPPDRKDLNKDIDERLFELPNRDLEYQMEELCIFKQINTLRVAVSDITGVTPLMKVSDHLTDVAEVVVNTVLDLSWNHLVDKHGKPNCMLDERPCEKGFVVIAYGKLGGIELGYGSDLDLVFLHAGMEGQTSGKDLPIDNAQFFARLGQRVVHILTTHTPAGNLYEIDMRLRPSGSGGILVSHIESFNNYQMESAWTWEHQALIRARAIGGDRRLASRFEEIRKTVLSRSRDPKTLKADVNKMRKRMRNEHLKPESGVFDLKQDYGGIVDIEFLVQYLVLLKAVPYPQLLEWTDNVRLLQELAQTDVIDENTAYLMRKAYLIYRAAAHRLDLQEKPAKVSTDRFSALREHIQTVWARYMGSDT